ncbi:hypothetical protein CWI84_10975 [Idiomarina tyrosinivorans]|uniref:Type III pantothenate kinase n=1 Tax=Idiomarina tyrosinivorans TaxID=1445662 RepID=A0A432ZJK7_9GAMM|nr:type III pantothenate kinase [Idiomarina tyrosinivorans]RUO78197.1 hypothetical protein CWI84_10975 [Idiomarina tyrosinivorans]
MILCLDAGNSSLKLVTYADGSVLERQQWHYSADSSALQNWLQTIVAKVQVILGSCVANADTQAFIEAIVNEPIHWATSTSECSGVVNAYAQPENLGVDRWLTLLASHCALQQPTLTIDHGTALTFDWLTAAGQHLGGWITPGERLMRNSLNTATSRVRTGLENNAENATLAPAVNTQAGVSLGIYAALTGAVRQAINTSEQCFGTRRFAIVETGPTSLCQPLSYDADYYYKKDLVTLGLLLWGQSQDLLDLTDIEISRLFNWKE